MTWRKRWSNCGKWNAAVRSYGDRPRTTCAAMWEL